MRDSWVVAFNTNISSAHKDAEPIKCKCGAVISESKQGPATAHVLSCPSLPNVARIRRHNNVAKQVADVLHQAGVPVSVEISETIAAKKQRRLTKTVTPDLSVHASEPFFMDVAIVNPLAKSYVSSAKLAPLAAAATLEKRKTQHYQELLRLRPSYGFRPFVIETCGGWGKAATEFCTWLGRRYEQRHGLGGKERLLARFRASVSFALQRDNARAFRHALEVVAAQSRGPL